MNFLVTGGAGFIGSHIANGLYKLGHNITVLDNLDTGALVNLEPNIHFVEGSVGDLTAVLEAADGCTAIIHQAALANVPQSIKEPQLNHDVNVTGTSNVFEAARLLGIKRVVYASSAAVYGDEKSLPKRETSPIQPLTPYAMAKYTNELYATIYNNLYGLECIGLRYMNVFGPKQNPASPYSGVISIFCKAVMEQTSITIYGDGHQTRDFVYIDDVVQANLKALQIDWTKVQSRPIFNVGRGQQTSLRQLITALEEISSQKLSVTYQPARAGDIRHSYADISHIQTILGYESYTSILEGLTQTLAWFQAQTDQRSMPQLQPA